MHTSQQELDTASHAVLQLAQRVTASHGRQPEPRAAPRLFRPPRVPRRRPPSPLRHAPLPRQRRRWRVGMHRPLLGSAGRAAAPATSSCSWIRPPGHLAVALPGGASVPPLPLIVPDLLGFGGSSCDSASAPAPSEATQAAALAALLDSVEGLKGKRVAVAGTSYGGFVAYWLARAAGPRRVGPVVIASSDLLKTAADDRGFLKRAGEGWSGVEQVLLPAEPAEMRKLMEMAVYRPPPALMTPDFVLRDFIQKLFTDNREQLIHLFKGITVGTDKFQVTPLSQEVLIVWGEHDQLFPVEKAFAIQRSLDGKSRVEVIKKTGHAPQIEDPTHFNKILLDFLLAAQKPDPCINGTATPLLAIRSLSHSEL